MTISKDIKAYNAKLKGEDKKIASILSKEIDTNLKGSENKVWHAHPVWFLDRNPIVGYSKLKDSVRLLFWSGQSFKEKGLSKEGSFKAADARYSEAKEVNKRELKTWLKKAKDIQWDYKNIVKRKGVLVKIKTTK